MGFHLGFLDFVGVCWVFTGLEMDCSGVYMGFFGIKRFSVEFTGVFWGSYEGFIWIYTGFFGV